MFEAIGILVVVWLGFTVVGGIFRGISRARSQEFGKEARRISTVELSVPSSYYNYLTISKMEEIKSTALQLRDRNEKLKGSSWPRLLALVIYGQYHHDCEQWQRGNPRSEQLFQSIRISPLEISKELARDSKAVVSGSI